MRHLLKTIPEFLKDALVYIKYCAISSIGDILFRGNASGFFLSPRGKIETIRPELSRMASLKNIGKALKTEVFKRFPNVLCRT